MEEFFERIRKRIKELMDELNKEIEETAVMWTPDGVLEPLVSLNEYPDHYEIIIDLPYADLNALSINIRNHKMIIECSLREELRFEKWGAYREIRFHRYKTTITLPPDADTEKLDVVKDEARKIIRIILPKKST